MSRLCCRLRQIAHTYRLPTLFKPTSSLPTQLISPRAGLRITRTVPRVNLAESPSYHKLSLKRCSIKWRPPVLSQPYPGTADLCPGGPVPSPQLVGTNMENSTVEKIPSSYFSIRKRLFSTEGLVTLKVACLLSL